MEGNGKISLGKVLFVIVSILVIGGGVLLLNYKNNEVAAGGTKQTQKDNDSDNEKDNKEPDKVYESFSYTRKQICGEKDNCEKTFTYDGKEYKLVMKEVEDDKYDNDEMDSMAFNTVTLNGIDVADGIMDYLNSIYFTKSGFIAVELTDSLTGKNNALIFYDTNLEIAAAFNSIRPFNYDGSQKGKFYRCSVSGDDSILKEYEFEFTNSGKFTDKKVSEKKEDCFN